MAEEEVVKVFISYSWDSEEHKAKVLTLSDTLRKHGIDCQIDRYHQSPPEGWYRWMMNQVDESDFVLVVCTEKYNLRYRNREEQGQGRGVTWEGGLIIAELYEGQGINKKFIPVVLSPNAEAYIPESLKHYTVYRLFNNEDYNLIKPGDYQSLYRHLTNQPELIPAALGKPQELPPLYNSVSFNLGSAGEVIETVDEEKAERKRQIQLEQQRQAEELERLRQAEQLRQQQVEAEKLRQEELDRQRQERLQQEAEKKRQQEQAKQPLPDALKGDYALLEALLEVGKWKEANDETAEQMCKVMRRQQEGWLRVEDIKQFPIADLCEIDRLWVQYSKRYTEGEAKFGFSVQKQIWVECGSPKYNLLGWEKFCAQVGWLSWDGTGTFKHARRFKEMTFDTSAPKGHLPYPYLIRDETDSNWKCLSDEQGKRAVLININWHGGWGKTAGIAAASVLIPFLAAAVAVGATSVFSVEYIPALPLLERL